MNGWAARLGFFAFALIGSPLVVWLLREWIYERDGTTLWIWMIGLPALVTVLAGGLLRRPGWELVLGAALSAGCRLPQPDRHDPRGVLGQVRLHLTGVSTERDRAAGHRADLSS